MHHALRQITPRRSGLWDPEDSVQGFFFWSLNHIGTPNFNVSFASDTVIFSVGPVDRSEPRAVSEKADCCRGHAGCGVLGGVLCCPITRPEKLN